MNPIAIAGPRGTQEGRKALYALMGTTVLENIAGLCDERILRGQARPDRASLRQRFPEPARNYKDKLPVGYRPRQHHFWPEIATVAEGKLDIFIGEHFYQAKRGDWIVLKSEIPHGVSCTQNHDNFRLVWFEMERPIANVHVTDYQPGSGYKLAGILELPPLPTSLRGSENQLFNENWPPVEHARMHLLRFVGWIMELLNQSLDPASSNASQKVLKVEGLLLNNNDTYPSVKELAGSVGLSANYLSSLFHAQKGRTLRQYIADLRIGKAKNYLADPETSIKDVAYRLGFQNPFHFSHVFRQVTGMTPKAYKAWHAFDTGLGASAGGSNQNT